MATEPKGFFGSDVVKAYLDEQGAPYEKDEVEYWLDPAKEGKLIGGTAVVPKGGNGGNVSLPYAGEFLCMDVGCWAGNGPKSDKNHQRHREFGVVCGNVAALCSFPGGGSEDEFAKGRRGVFEVSGGMALYRDRIKPFLDHLSGTKLGRARVHSALALPQAPSNDPIIHLFIGDLHLPVVTDKAKTDLDARDRQSVPRAGRLDLSARVKAKAQVALAAGGAAGVASWISPPFLAAAAITPYAGYEAWAIHDLFEDQRIASWDTLQTDGLMPLDEANEWADYYLGKDGKKGAEIFQSAGADLEVFLAQLEKWKGAAVHLVQTGDLMDFWIGLKHGFTAAKGGVIVSPAGKAFADFWYEKTSKNGGAGRVVQAFERIKSAGNPSLKLTVLYGNHDNYLARTKSLPACYDHGTLFAEHGHQSDGFNADEDAWKGWALTQLAFLQPAIRDYEDMAAATVTSTKRIYPWATDPGARLQRLARAADVCHEKQKAIYVLGHTHQAMLRKLTVRAELDRTKVCESGYQCTLAWADRERAHAAALQKEYSEVVEGSKKRLKDAAEAFTERRIDEARRGIAAAHRELADLRDATEGFARENVAKADARLREAESALVHLGRVTEARARQKAEEARQIGRASCRERVCLLV